MFVFGLTKSFKRLSIGDGCISNTLINGCVAHYNTKVNDVFFNRKRELIKFKNAFSAMPEFHVILGPPSTGKTALIREITSKGNFNPLFIDCRKGQFDTPERIYDSIYSQFKPFFDDNKGHLERVIGKQFKVDYADFNVGYKLSEARKITSSDVTKLLDNINAFLPKWTLWDGYSKPPILIIDEANMFSQLSNSSKEGKILLKTILNWLVVNTKQENRFHVVLTSSDSFFLNWIINLLQIPHVTPYVVGDLSREEAEEYFEKHVLPQYECKELEGKFDHICKITGTRMLIIERYVKEYKIEGKLADRKFSVFRLEYDKLHSGLVPFHSPDKPYDPLWNRDELIKVMKAVVKAENQGFILEADLEKEISHEKIHSLVDYNFLHRRPTNNFAFDIINPPDEVILTAMNKPSLRAMEYLLNDLGETLSSK